MISYVLNIALAMAKLIQAAGYLATCILWGFHTFADAIHRNKAIVCRHSHMARRTLKEVAIISIAYQLHMSE